MMQKLVTSHPCVLVIILWHYDLYHNISSIDQIILWIGFTWLSIVKFSGVVEVLVKCIAMFIVHCDFRIFKFLRLHNWSLMTLTVVREEPNLFSLLMSSTCHFAKAYSFFHQRCDMCTISINRRSLVLIVCYNVVKYNAVIWSLM